MIAQAKKYWYAAQLKPNGFNKAKLNLIRQGFDCFMPMRNVTIRHARKLKRRNTSYFPGLYLY